MKKMKKKQREKPQAWHWGAPWTILQISSKVQKIYKQKKKVKK